MTPDPPPGFVIVKPDAKGKIMADWICFRDGEWKPTQCAGLDYVPVGRKAPLFVYARPVVV